MSFSKIHYLTLTCLALFSACGKKNAETTQFQALGKEKTGLDFQNVLRPTVSFNALSYMYFYNGGGTAAGDFNNDGLTDLYFTSNMGVCKMYLNEGGLKFRDVTEQAGVGVCDPATNEGCGWTSGVSVTDINNDGMLDLYLSRVGEYLTIKGRNLLYVCKEIKDGVPVYEEEAIRYGLDFVGFGTQAAFLDYDLDGDLDMYQLNHSVHQNGTFGQKKSFEGSQHPLSGDKLLRNELISKEPGGGQTRFTETTLKAGINSTVIGYGLGIASGDVNMDGWPDIYIGNDFHENDYLYINQRNGTFKESLTERIQHTSQFSMGVDIGDINNDAQSEIISLDMLPEDPYILKSSLGEDEYGIFQFKLTYGYAHQYARNTLQLNNGDGTFSEIGMYAGVHATDWSWATMFMDFDNDGYKDLFVSNGIVRRMNDVDYANFRTDNEDLRFKQGAGYLEESDLSAVEKMPKIKLPNKFFRNSGRLTFQDMEKQVEGNTPTFSNGAVYADFDNDGDLDVVVNNLEDSPSFYQNMQMENGKGQGADYWSLKLEGSPANRFAVGAKAVAFKKGETILCENFPVRGYESSALTPLHIGVGDAKMVDSILLIWPDNTFQRIENGTHNKTLTLRWTAGLPVFDYSRLQRKPEAPFQFADRTQQTGLDYKHSENPFVEFNRERLIPHMVSAEGPALAVGDLNGDRLDDVFFGSSKNRKSALYFQKADGTFYLKTPDAILRDSIFEDVDAAFTDLDNDGDLDIAIAAGGNEFWDQQEAMKQRAYINDGQGNFHRLDFQGIYMTASCILPADVNNDGLTDLFLGARAIPWKYGLTPSSALLLNKGGGVFEEAADRLAPGLREAGLVKSGTWADIDADGDQDLLLALEWDALTVFVNNGGRFEKKALDSGKGWWNFALPHDFDGDGDIDILAGNLGQNAKFKPSPAEPVRLYVNDFDDNQQIDQILTYYVKGQEIPFANYAEITKTMPSLKKKYLYAKDFAKASLSELFGKEKLAKSTLREADMFSSVYLENTGNGAYKRRELPAALQFSPLEAAALCDLDGDGRQEVLIGGNFYEANIEMGRYDASPGHVLSIGADGAMKTWPLGDLRIRGQIRRIKSVRAGDQTLWLLARNNDTVIALYPLGARLSN